MSKSPITTDSDTPVLKMPPIHPGEVLADELAEIGVSANALARALDVPPNRITEILNGKRAVTADTALRLACYFGTSARFWLNLQMNHDLAMMENERGQEISKIVRPYAA